MAKYKARVRQKKGTRIEFRATKEQKEVVQALADALTDGNKSRLILRLVYKAKEETEKPE